MSEYFCMNCEILKEQVKELQNTISQLKQDNLKLLIQTANLETELQQYTHIKPKHKTHNKLLCFFGIHDYTIKGMGYERQCSTCGKRQIRVPLAPDGICGPWKNNY